MIRDICLQLALGMLLASVLLIFGLCYTGAGAGGLLREALRRPEQIPAIWLGAVTPFAIGFLATGLCFSGRGPSGGAQAGWPRRGQR